MADGPVLVLGARGMLGTDVMAALAAAGLPARGLDLPDFDITDDTALANVILSEAQPSRRTSGPIISTDDTAFTNVILSEAQPSRRTSGPVVAVINCAAYTDVERAEDHEALAHRINADAVGALGRLAAAAGVYVIHISTDFVFDGRKDGPYTEDDLPNPISAYGRTKLAGERALVESGCRHAILRIQWTYGRAGNHFVSKIAALARSHDRIRVVDDQRGAPTATTEVAAVIRTLLAARPEGVFHFAAAGEATRFDVARAVVERLGLPTMVEPCASDTFPTKAARPANSRFDCTRIRTALPGAIRPWREVLEEYLEEGA